MTSKIPLNDLKRQTELLQAEILQATAEVVHSGHFVLGRQVAAFEAEFAAFVGVPICVGVGNGTDALELALRAVGCGVGTEVVTVANAGMYTSAAAVGIGATPVFADIDDGSLTMDPQSLAGCLSDRTKAIVVTHLYGQMAAIDDIVAIGQRHGIPIVEDCAQAHGAQRGGRRAGSFGAVGCFSFYPTKNLGAVGDGGAVVTADQQIGATLRSLRQYGWERKYEAVTPHGRNSRLDEIQAAILREKLPHLDRWNSLRRDIVRRYRAAAASGVRLPDADDETYVGHLCVARTAHRAALRAWLDLSGITTDLHYPLPDHRQRALQGLCRTPVSLVHTERVSEEMVTLPCFPEMTEDEIGQVCAALHGFRAE